MHMHMHTHANRENKVEKRRKMDREDVDRKTETGRRANKEKDGGRQKWRQRDERQRWTE